MKVSFIRPNMGRGRMGRYVDEGRMEPLSLGVLSALTPPDIEQVLHDDRIEDIPFDEPTDLAAITVETFTARRAYEIAGEYRQRGVPVVLGGMHPTLAPQEAARHADSLVTSDAESVWMDLLRDVGAGRLKSRYEGRPGPPHPGCPPRRALYAGKSYLPLRLTQFNRGCCFDCAFCAISSYFDRRMAHRRIDEVVAELSDHNGSLIFFVDDNISANPGAAKELFRALIPLRLHWVSQSSLTMTEDAELMDLMARSGCLGHVIGFESLQAASLIELGKQHNVEDSRTGYRRALRVLKDHGLQTWAAFLLGCDHDTPESIARTADFAVSQRFSFAAFNLLTPYPGTPLYQDLERQGRLLYGGKWWLHEDYRFNTAAFRPALMKPEELTEACENARRQFNSLPSLLYRAMDLRTTLRTLRLLCLHVSYNLLVRREIRRKRGLRLGQNG